ncbi:MAG TPA: hypothetical protein VGG99_03990 [Acetobacteraceae bacterium]|jgi:hypothetical protein
MSRLAELREKIITAFIPPLLALTLIGLDHVPPAMLVRMLTLLTAWACMALPLAVLFGHCALGEE